MKKIILSLITALVILPGYASHMNGGEISWQCAGNDQYIFTLTLYRDCNGASMPLQPQSILNDAGLPAISCAFSHISDLSTSCYDPQQTISCAKAQATPPGVYMYGAITKYVFISDTISIAVTPPAQGISFYFNSNGRPSSALNLVGAGYANFHITSKLFTAKSGGGCLSDSPNFMEDPITYIKMGKASMTHMAAVRGNNDSLHYRLTNPLTASNTPVSFAPGYSGLAPLPDQSEHPNNGPITIDGSNGTMHYDIYSGAKGRYTVGIMVENWVGGNLHSTVLRDFTIYLDDLPTSNAPQVTLDTTTLNLWQKVNDNKYVIYTFPGDSLYFELNSTDSDLNPNGSPQFIKATFASEMLDTANSPFSSWAHIAPVAPQAGFTASSANNIWFVWNITQPMSTVDYPVYQYLFRFEDDNCSYPYYTEMVVEIRVEKLADIKSDTLRICQGDSIMLRGSTSSGQYLWSPAQGINDPGSATPSASPAISRYYYLQDPQFPGVKDSVFVEVQTRGSLGLQADSTNIYTSGTANLNLNIWYFNGLPFKMNTDTIQAIGAGDYLVQGLEGICQYWSDTLRFGQSPNLVNVHSGNGNVANGQISLDSTLGFAFQLNTPYGGMLDTLYLLGISSGKLKTAGDTLHVKVYESQSEVFSHTFLLNNPTAAVIAVPAGIYLDHQKEYTLTLGGDTGIYIYTYENVVYPHYSQDSKLLVKGAYRGPAGQIPTQHSDNLPAVVLRMQNGFSLPSHKQPLFSLYPNPVENTLFIDGLSPENPAEISIADMQGRVVMKASANTGKLSLHNLSPGTYLLQIEVNQTHYNYPIIKN